MKRLSFSLAILSLIFLSSCSDAEFGSIGITKNANSGDANGNGPGNNNGFGDANGQAGDGNGEVNPFGGPGNNNGQNPSNAPGGNNLGNGNGADSLENPCFNTVAKDETQNIKVSGENWPNNSIDPGGADFDDYFVEISGKFYIKDDWEIFSAVDQEIQVKYSLGTPYMTQQTVKIGVVDCDKNDKGSFTVSSGNGNRTISAKKGERFNLETESRTGAQTRSFDLLKDRSSAYRVRK